MTAEASDAPRRPTLGDWNRIARENADLRDEMATLRAEQAELQERWGRAIAEVRLAAGLTAAEVTDEVYEDAYDVLQRVKDRCWEQGRAAAIVELRGALDALAAGGSDG